MPHPASSEILVRQLPLVTRCSFRAVTSTNRKHPVRAADLARPFNPECSIELVLRTASKPSGSCGSVLEQRRR